MNKLYKYDTKKVFKKFLRNMAMTCIAGVSYIGMCSVTGYAAENIYVTVDDVVFEILSDGTAVLRDGSKVTGEYEIPSYVSYNGQNYVVTTIGKTSFYGNTAINKLIMSDTVKTIEEPDSEDSIIGAFEDCISLEEVVFSENMEFIGDWAFNDCVSLKNVEFPDGLKVIGAGAFDDCMAITSIVLPESVIEVRQHAFSDTSIKTFTIPATAELFSEWALKSIPTLEWIDVENEHPYFVSYDGVLYSLGYGGILIYPENKKGETYVVHENATIIYSPAFGDNPYLKTLVLNDKMHIASFSSAMLQNTNIESIVVPVENPYIKSKDGVVYTKDGKNLLFYPPAKKDKIFFVPDGVKEIGYNEHYYSFETCQYLEELYIPSSVEIWSGQVWYSDSIKKVVFASESNLKTLDEFQFAFCTSLESICLPKSITNFRSGWGNQFYDCINLTKLYIAQGAPFYTEATWGSQSLSGASNLTVYGHGKDNMLTQMVDEYGYYPYVDVSEGFEGVLGVTFADTVLKLKRGDIKNVDAVVYPVNSTQKELTYVSSDPNIAKVSADGTVTAMSLGVCYITAIANDGSGEYARCQINVVLESDGLYRSADGNWYYYTDNEIDTTYTGMAKNAYGWWYVKNGKLDRTYTGLAKNAYGTWYMKNGKLDTTLTGMYKAGNTWVYVNKGKFNENYTGMAKNAYGWWYMKDGKLDRTYTGMALYNGKWIYVNKGKLDTGYTGMAENTAGVWYMKEGKLDRTYTGMALYNGQWIYVNKGKFDTGYTGMARNSAGVWYMKKGVLDRTYTGMYVYNGQWVYVNKGKIDWSYTGLAKNAYGTWYMKNGKLDTSYSGKIICNGKTYTIKNGRVV